jgi:cell division protein FtsB
MCSKKFFGRVLPFFATFLVGVFIASFFVSFGRPSFGSRRARHFQQDQQIRLENDQLREENMRLKEQINDRQMNFDHPNFSDNDVRSLMPPPPPLPVKPAAPRAIR